MSRRRSIVVLGMMSKHPVPGVIWQTLHYLVGFERLGFEAYYVEAGGHQPSAMLADGEPDTGDRSLRAAAFLHDVLQRFDLGDRWAFQALHADRRCYGLSELRLRELWREAELIINLHGGTTPRAEHAATGRLVYLETDPVALQIELHRRRPRTIAFLEPHAVFFTFGENYGTPHCPLPVSPDFTFIPTRQPVVREFWETATPPGAVFTTIGNWMQRNRPVRFRGEVYHWSKHLEFLKVLDLPGRTGQTFELALSSTSLTPEDHTLLAGHGWRVRPAFVLARDLDPYRDYIRSSLAEFTVAKDQNVRFRTGWFSDRSACYLAAGRPVITQDTGFGDVLPTGAGLFPFRTLDEAADAVAHVAAEPGRHSRAAAEIAREFFDHEVVLGQLLQACGAAFRRGRARPVSLRPHPLGLAIDRLQDAMQATRERIRQRRAAFEAERDAGRMESARLHRAELNRARAQLRALQARLEEIEDRHDGVHAVTSGSGVDRP